MEVTGPTAHRSAVRSRSGPVACGCALVAGAFYLAANDPSAPGSHFPACGLHALTGLWCPACGLTRGTHALLRGDIAGALSSNLFTPLVVVAVALGWWSWVRRSWGAPADRVRRTFVELLPRWSGPALAATLVVFGVLRNLPRLHALAP